MKGDRPYLQAKREASKATKGGNTSSNPHASDSEATGKTAYDMNPSSES